VKFDKDARAPSMRNDGPARGVFGEGLIPVGVERAGVASKESSNECSSAELRGDCASNNASPLVVPEI